MKFDHVLDQGRVILADGLIAGKPFAGIISDIMALGERYGEDEAAVSTSFFVTTSQESFEEALRNAVAAAFEQLFSKNCQMSTIVYHAAAAGAAIGFKVARARQKENVV